MKESLITRIACGLSFFLTGLLFNHTVDLFPSYPIYYLIAAVVDTLFVLYLPIFGHSSLIRDLQLINWCSVATQFYGFIIYMCYYPPASYNWIIGALTFVQWVRLIWVRKNDTHSSGNNFWLDSIFNSYFNLQRSHHTEANR